MIELLDGIFIAPEHVAMVKKVDKNKCSLFFVGSSAVDGGHLIDYPAEQVAEVITDYLDGEETEEDEE